MRKGRLIFYISAVLFAINAFGTTTLYASTNSTSSYKNTDTLTVYFKTGSWSFNPANIKNREIADRLAAPQLLEKQYSNFCKKLSEIIIEGTASPEGKQRWNTTLSQRRAEQIRKYILANTSVQPHTITWKFTGSDWETLRRMVQQDPNVPHRNRVLEFLAQTNGSTATDATVAALQKMEGGTPYKYLYHNIFPKLRATKLEFVYERIPNIGILSPMEYTSVVKSQAEHQQQPIQITELQENVLTTEQVTTQEEEHKFFMALKSNLLYDVAITPNIGAEFRLGKHYSVQGNWMYAWWKSDPDAWYHRTYGGDISLRRWLGKAHHNRPLTGWHAGIYAQMVTYDFEWGGRGYLGDRWSWGAGIEGGWSKAVGKRLNIDFSLNFGYLTGEYKEYLPIDGCYVWQATKQRHWIGPTKAEVSLVWLIGRW